MKQAIKEKPLTIILTITSLAVWLYPQLSINYRIIIFVVCVALIVITNYFYLYVENLELKKKLEKRNQQFEETSQKVEYWKKSAKGRKNKLELFRVRWRLMGFLILPAPLDYEKKNGEVRDLYLESTNKIESCGGFYNDDDE